MNCRLEKESAFHLRVHKYHSKLKIFFFPYFVSKFILSIASSGVQIGLASRDEFFVNTMGCSMCQDNGSASVGMITGMGAYEKQLAILMASDSRLTVRVDISANLCNFYTFFEGLDRVVCIKCFS
jgi:hypothetical protein